MSILVIIEENIDFIQNFRTDFNFGQNFWKSQFWSKFTKNSNLVKIVEKYQFGQPSRKFSILVQIVEKC